MKNILLSGFIVLFPTVVHAADFDKAVEYIQKVCASGSKLEIKSEASGGISFLKNGLEGDYNFTREEALGVVDSTNEELKFAESSEIRKCMQQFAPTVLAILEKVDSESAALADNYLPKKVIVPVGGQLSILDGAPLLTVSKVYEYNGGESADVLLEIPYRSNKIFKMGGYWNSKKTNFKYRDSMYKISLDHVNLQDQNVTVTIVEQKTVNK